MRVLFIGAHTDDIELGAGGTLIKFLEQDHDVMGLTMSCPEPKDKLKKEWINSGVFLTDKLTPIEWELLEYKPRHFPEQRQAILEELIQVKDSFRPDLVIAHGMSDMHQDHHTIAVESFRCFKNYCSIWSYECPWNNQTLNPNTFVQLTEKQVTKKIKLIKLYKSQLKLRPNIFNKDFIMGWSRSMGTMTSFEYAEAFECVRCMNE